MKMGTRPFHDWYQEWSTHASRLGANDKMLMYAFQQALLQGLNDKLVGVTPAPTTFAGLVEKARHFDQQWQLWRRPAQSTNSSQRPQGPRVRSNNMDSNDPSINAVDTEVRAFKKLSKEEQDNQQKNNECFYCGKKYHFAKDCHS